MLDVHSYAPVNSVTLRLRKPIFHQPLFLIQVLTYGIGTAAVLRLVMILLGSELIESWKPILLLFAGILIFSSYKLLASGDSGDEEDEDLTDNGIVKLCR